MKLPKIIHQIWVGDKLFPEQDLIWSESLKRTNPHWTFVLHAENPECMPKDGPWDVIREVPNSSSMMSGYLLDVIRDRMSPKRFPAAYADLARLEVLIRDGGVYFDTDVVGINPIDDIMDGLTLGLAWEYSQNQIGNFFIGATPRHPALINTLNEIHKTTIGAISACHDLNPFWTTGPKVVEKVLPEYPDCVIFPFSVMSPWNPTLPFPENYEEIPFRECTRVVHLFDSKWTHLPRDPNIPLDQGLDFHVHDGHCRDEHGRWCPEADGHWHWPCYDDTARGKDVQSRYSDYKHHSGEQ
jgi:mannosyltransferase OCH1-like enzyme